jgi:Tol biopolymer transport system component
MSADGSGQQRLTADPADEVDPEWSSDGKRIVFDRDLTVDVRGGLREIRQLFVMRADGSAVEQVTSLPGSSGHAAWSRVNGRER